MGGLLSVGGGGDPSERPGWPQKGIRRPLYKRGREATSTVKLDNSAMWVASCGCDAWGVARREALLGHEQIQYQVGALSARDYAKDFEAITARTYDSSSAGLDALKAELARNSEATAQALQAA